MADFPLPVNEKERLEKLRSYQILDTLPEQEFEDIVSLASIICDTPISLISLVDENRQWFKAHQGLDASETDRDVAFCNYTILADEIMEIEDSHVDARFAGNPLVTGDPHIRFYAGAPLTTSDGFKIGTLCVIDRVPKKLSETQKQAMRFLSNAVIAQLELRKKNRELEAEKESKKIAEEALQANERKYRELIENAGDIFYTTNHKGLFTYINSSLKINLQYEVEDLIGKHFTSIVHPDWVEKVGAFYLVQFQNRTPITTNEFPVISKNGDMVWMEQVVVLIESGEMVKGFQCVVRNIESRKALENALISAKQVAEEGRILQERFLANMSHEIRTPMNGILGMTRLMMNTNLDKDQQEFIETIKESADNLLVIINDILDISKINAGKIVLEERAFNIGDTLRHVVRSLMHKAEEKGIYLKAIMDDGLEINVVSDPVRLSQVMINLLGNAVKFTEVGGVTLSVSIVNETETHYDIDFVFKDTGIGISADKIDTIFESFTQASSNTTRLYGGTGLGLSIVQQLVDLLGGNISVKSTVGQGSVFTVRLSLLKGSREDLAKTSLTTKVYHDLKGVRVLVAEDNKINQRVAVLTLAKWSAHTEVAENGKIALQMLKEREFDLVLMDLQMPEMGGDEATRAIRALDSPVRNIPIIAMTAAALHGEYEKCIAIGMTDYISKPFDPKLLNEKIWMLSSGKVQKTQASSVLYTGDHVTEMTYLDSISEGDVEFKKEMITMFIETIPREIQAIEENYKMQRWKELKATLHKLKSSLSMMGMTSICDGIVAIEAMGGSLENETTSDFIKLLRQSCEKAFEELERVKQTL